MRNGLCMDVSMIENEEAAERIRNLTIPGCLLNRPLIVGDPEQVNAVKELERKADSILLEYDEDNEELREYTVDVEMSGKVRVYVNAINEDEAEDLAEEEARGVSFEDLEIEDVSVVCVKRL